MDIVVDGRLKQIRDSSHTVSTFGNCGWIGCQSDNILNRGLEQVNMEVGCIVQPWLQCREILLELLNDTLRKWIRDIS